MGLSSFESYPELLFPTVFVYLDVIRCIKLIQTQSIQIALIEYVIYPKIDHLS